MAGRNDSHQMKEILQDFDPFRGEEANGRERAAAVNTKPPYSGGRLEGASGERMAIDTKRSYSGSSMEGASGGERITADTKCSYSGSSMEGASGERITADTKHSYSGGSMEGARVQQNVDFSSSSQLKRIPQCNMSLDPLHPCASHTILIDVDAFYSKRRLIPQHGYHYWNENFVKMPFSPENVLNAKTKHAVKRWNVICHVLGDLGKQKSVSVRTLEEGIMTYNPTYKGQWSFDCLAKLVTNVHDADNYIPRLFPKIARLAIQLDGHVMKAIPLLKRGRPLAITLSQIQIACLLANAFLCTFPHRNTSHPKAEYSNYPTINFSSLFGQYSAQKEQKLRAILHYFKVVTDDNKSPEGLVTFERHYLKNTDQPDWKRCVERMSRLHVTSEGSIEDQGEGMLQVDFCNSLIGGGVLGSGLVQEEIQFLMNPELIVARLFTERLEGNECLIIKGTQQFSIYKGYRNTFEWTGPYEDKRARDEWRRRHRQTLAIDALYYKHKQDQYDMKRVTRELNKAYCGFLQREPDCPDIATGNWGCGVYNGDPQLKAVIQLMAAAVAQRGLAFFTFGSIRQENELNELYHLLVKHGVQVGRLYCILERYCKTNQQVNLFSFIKKEVDVYQSSQL